MRKVIGWYGALSGKRKILLLVGTFVVASILVFSDATETATNPDDQKHVATSSAMDRSESTHTADKSPATSKTYAVAYVVDGDTVKISMNGTLETVRLIGLDAPETSHPTELVECFGAEATEYATQLLAGKDVQLETDDTQATRDKYDRLLGYLILPDGRNVSEVMIENGYAHEYTYNIPYTYQAEFQAAEQRARENERGLWAPGACDEFEAE